MSLFVNKELRKFSLIELISVTAVISILASILMSELEKVREASIRAGCINNMSQLSKAYFSYASKNSQTLVSSETWNANGHAPAWFLQSSWSFDQNVVKSPLWPYINNAESFRCPSETRDARFKNGNYKRSYSISVYLNGRGWVSNIVSKVARIDFPSNTMQFLDDADPRGRNLGSFVPGYPSLWVDWPGSNHGSKKIPLSFFDGHVETYTYKENTTSQISWFWSRIGYHDRMAFINMSDPDVGR